MRNELDVRRKSLLWSRANAEFFFLMWTVLLLVFPSIMVIYESCVDLLHSITLWLCCLLVELLFFSVHFLGQIFLDLTIQFVYCIIKSWLMESFSHRSFLSITNGTVKINVKSLYFDQFSSNRVENCPNKFFFSLIILH